ncbi:MAG: FKBP-type peptidyl-prolyl cis-trans isomerase [Candidatus Kapabacteria bacterium]|nr:FKBP-type peptidyl-prolyl cis-trans isomerase [Candidatus Kapabacteria bacterium]
MKKISCLAILFVLAFMGCKDQASIKNLAKPSNIDDQMSYMIGLQIGKNFVRDTLLKLNVEYFYQGINQQLQKDTNNFLLKQAEQDSIQRVFQERMSERNKANTADQQKQMNERGTKMKDISAKLIEQNSKRPGVKVTSTGLQYEVITAGKGKRATIKDNIKFHMIITLADGTEVDNTYKREPVIMPLDKLPAKGWQEAFTLMPVGSKWRVVVPSNLGFDNQPNPTIPQNTALICDMELLSLEKSVPAPPGMPQQPPQ